ncbi:type II toxin-antitoxin system RelE/ParE family toxin [Flavobacterium zepuense]|uniref:Type II toxin-antitoxin system RelE/ParE family toxin n=1 Tax=Flavobacterium zepuense TaxID=2593302 RepID=A0A552V4B7_9FLAO|nr:type II toxin-antitoxin system RelE/ParE family toxin [Flavobacterium zepuense]TRW25298.1 type II toxin-antitoxin system RelE/ParE family toxin [Flavobacterium zepuense]
MYIINLSDLAARKLDDLLDYLEREWSLKIANNFEDNFEKKLLHISKYPESCIKSKQFPNLHLCVVTKQTSFLYRIKPDEIEVVTVLDNRSSFKSITKEIRKYYGRI